MIPAKVNNSTIMNTNDNEVEEIWNKEFKGVFITMINEMKEDMDKCLNEFQEKTNKQLNK
jgi:hypothetical protein